MVQNFHEDLKSRWLFIDVVEGFIVVVVGFVLLLGEFFHSPVPFPLYFVESSVNFSLGFLLFAGIIVLLLSFPFVLVDSSVGRR